MIGHLIRVGALALVCAASAAHTAAARTVYDGSWSVLIVTENGLGVCDRAYRYGVQIVDGRVLYEGGGAINFTGRVERNGAVRVVVTAGNQRASGQGRMSRSVGEGRWRGQSSNGTCSGYWQAERRG
jgi:hypothetical protein